MYLHIQFARRHCVHLFVHELLTMPFFCSKVLYFSSKVDRLHSGSRLHGVPVSANSKFVYCAEHIKTSKVDAKFELGRSFYYYDPITRISKNFLQVMGYVTFMYRRLLLRKPMGCHRAPLQHFLLGTTQCPLKIWMCIESRLCHASRSRRTTLQIVLCPLCGDSS